MIRLGIDLVDIDKLAQLAEVSGDAFLNMAWTVREQGECCGRPDGLASRWAAKEATMKALGVGLGDIDPLDVEIQTEDGRTPRIVLYGGARDRANEIGVRGLSVSISHDRRVAIAFVIGLGDSDE
jgi:holo-[acyl-carrier protein] synthase